MIEDVKALIVVFGLTAPLWYFTKRHFAPLSAPGDFERRRNVWLYLTALGLLSPSIWIYAFFALPVIYWAGKRDSNPVALYILIFYVIPNTPVPLPSIVVNQLFDINHHRLLAFSVILPALLRASRLHPNDSGAALARGRRLHSVGWLLIGYICLTILIPLPYESATNTVRRTVLAVLDIGVLYAMWSRISPRYEVFRDCLGAWVLAALMMSAVAMFETARGWLLYVSIAEQWGAPNIFAYLMRGGLLRAQVTAGHSLTLGIWLAIAWAFFLFVQSSWTSRVTKIVFGLVLLGGLAASMARGAWIAAMFATVVFALLNPGGTSSRIKSLCGLLVSLGFLMMSPLGDRIMEMIPFVGSVDVENVEYRKRLLETSIALIAHNPWFGDPFVLNQMESLRQGQGIIDLVNGYLTVALFSGLVGLGLFLGFLLLAVIRGYKAWRILKWKHPELGLLGGALLAAMLGTMLFIATAGIDPMTYMLAGLLSSYWWLMIRSDELRSAGGFAGQKIASSAQLTRPSRPDTRKMTR